MDIHERKQQSAIRYRGFIAPAFKFLVEEAGHALPTWLTKSTMNGELNLGLRLDDFV